MQTDETNWQEAKSFLTQNVQTGKSSESNQRRLGWKSRRTVLDKNNNNNNEDSMEMEQKPEESEQKSLTNNVCEIAAVYSED